MAYHDSLDSAVRKTDMTKHFPATSKDLVDLLRGMLEYNPHFRLTAAECLESPVFNGIRQEECEKPAPNKINLKVYEAGAYDYTHTKESATKYTIDDFKQMLDKEILEIQALRSKSIHLGKQQMKKL